MDTHTDTQLIDATDHPILHIDYCWYGISSNALMLGFCFYV